MPAGLAPWLMRAGAVALALLATTLTLTPLGIAPGRWPSPDLVFLLVAMLMLRRPEAMPLGLILALSLVSDLMRGAPLGIATLVLIAGRATIAPPRNRGRAAFLIEWMTIAALFLAALAAQLVALRLTFLPWPALPALAAYAAGTILAYPLLRLVAGAVLPLRPAGGEAA